MKQILELLETETRSRNAETSGGVPRISWPANSESNDIAMRSSGGLLALSAAIVKAERLSRGQSPLAEVRLAVPLPSARMQFGKRVFDTVFAAVALLFLMPVLLASALAIRIESTGPVLFRQRRIGQGGKPFFIIKFRTMAPDAEALLASYLASNPEAQREWDADHKLKNDPRVTGLGRTMRRLSLDELPQFWNVLRGDMSIVGPRPIVPAEITKYEDGFRDYCSVRPGITGLWQVSGRNDVGYDERVAFDRKYAEAQSPSLDAKILARTVGAVITASGSY